VFAALQQLPGWQVPPQQEVPTDDRNFSIDIAAVTAAGVRLAVEVDGPSHFVRMGGRWEVEGPTQYRNRALAARGYTVVSIPGWEWRQLNGACQQHQYLQDKIKGATGVLPSVSSNDCICPACVS
jgi:very-short-patch-repair endonuclease